MNMNLLADKRAFEKLLSFVIYLIIVVIIFLGVLQFINSHAAGDAVKEQILAKQISLFIDSAKPGTQIIIMKGKFIISLSKNEVNVKSKEEMIGYTYNFFTKNKVDIEQKEGVLTISIS